MSADLYNISSQLIQLLHSILVANQRLGEKKEEIRRLKKALSDLRQNKSDFIKMERICIEPELTAKTLHGDHGFKLESFRRNELLVSFAAIPNEQISAAENAINTKLQEVQEETLSIENSISGMESQYTYIASQKNKLERA